MDWNRRDARAALHSEVRALLSDLDAPLAARMRRSSLAFIASHHDTQSNAKLSSLLDSNETQRAVDGLERSLGLGRKKGKNRARCSRERAGS